ncbi:MAG TPA: hypothetical protein VFK80_03765 [Limnochordia bacterium]|nr:hypothetical protein [Limnochordia bacterium]
MATQNAAVEIDAILNEPALRELQALTDQTFMLWDEVRVGFSWRYYYMDHVLRVRANSLVLCVEEGGDLRALAYAATLHDITKRYDGPIKMDANGQRVVSADGFWINEPAMPARKNEVTEAYHKLGLYEQVHHESGGKVAAELLARRGFSPDFCNTVDHIIRGHLRPTNTSYKLGGPDDPYGDPASNSLYDADTTDANLGHVAFYRNIQIHGYNAIKKSGRLDLREYATSVERWVEGKRAFVDSRLSKTGLEVAEERHAANAVIAGLLKEETADEQRFELSRKVGLLGMIEFFLQTNEDPDMAKELDQLEQHWIPERRVAAQRAGREGEALLGRVERFAAELREECNPPLRRAANAGARRESV